MCSIVVVFTMTNNLHDNLFIFCIEKIKYVSNNNIVNLFLFISVKVETMELDGLMEPVD